MRTLKKIIHPKEKGEGHRITRSLKRNIKKEMTLKHRLLKKTNPKTTTHHMTQKMIITEPELIGEKQQKDI